MKKYLYFSFLGASLLLYLHTFYFHQLQAMAWISLALFGLSAVIVIGFGGWYIVEQMKVLRAKRIELEKLAHVLQVESSRGLWIRDTDHEANWHALHLEQRVYSNGHYEEPTEPEKQAWKEYLQIGPKSSARALPEPFSSGKVILLDELLKAPRTLIIGASNTGKTTLLQHLVRAKLQSSQVIIIDPHAYKSKWPVEPVGLGRDYETIQETLTGLVRLMTQRYEELASGQVAELAHPPLTIIIDEWRAITGNLADAGEAIRTLLTESRKVNFSIYVASHSDRAKPLGLKGEYDLKQGFTVVKLEYQNFQRVASIDFGSGPIGAEIPPAFSEVPRTSLTLPEAEPNLLEAQVLELAAEGLKPTPIAERIFGKKGGNQVRQIKEILEKWK